MREIEFTISNRWSGNQGQGTSSPSNYTHDFELATLRKGKAQAEIVPFGKTVSGWNPEELLLASLSSCHKLAYLYVCSQNGVNVQSYEDNAAGVLLVEDPGGHFQEVTLRPRIEISDDSNIEKAHALHEEATKYCFITKSVNFEVFIEADIQTSSRA